MNTMFGFAQDWLTQVTSATQKNLAWGEQLLAARTSEDLQKVVADGTMLARTNVEQAIALAQRQYQDVRQNVVTQWTAPTQERKSKMA